MSTLTTQIERNVNKADLWQRVFGTDRFLTWTVIISLFLFVGTIVLSIFVSRLLTGATDWIKPMKFAISITLYTGTLAWLLSYVTGHPRLVRWIAGLTALGFLVEIVGIFVQAARGRFMSDQIVPREVPSCSMSASLCGGDGVMRSRSVPRGTVG